MITCPKCGNRIAPRPAETLQLGRLSVDTGTRLAYVDGIRRAFGQGKEFTLLAEFVRHPGSLLSYDHLLNITDTWETGYRGLQVYKCRLAKRFGDVLEIVTCIGQGYAARERERGLP